MGVRERLRRGVKKGAGPSGDPEGRFRRIFHQSPVMVYMTDLEGTFLEINRAGVELLGYSSREEMVGAVSAKTIYADPAERFRFRDIIFRDGSVQEFTTRLRRPDGEIRDVAITSTARRDGKGEITGYEGFVVDITDRRRAEAALRESEEKYRTVVENCLAGIFVHQQGILRYINPRCLEVLGYDRPDEVIGRPFWEFVSPEDRDLVKDRGLRREKGYVFPPQYVFRLLRRDGAVVWVDMRAAKVTYMGQPAVVGNLYDITAGKRAEEQIRHLSRKLIDVIEDQQKKLAADLHDEFGQALTSVHFGLEALQAGLPPDMPAQKEQIGKMLRQVSELADGVRRTTSLLRPAILDHLGLVAAMEWYIQDFTNRRPEIEIEFHAAGLKKRLDGDTEIALYRIFQECLTNIAKHARATRVEVMLTHSHPKIILLVIDNGVGYEQAESGPWRDSQGIGLLSMRERAAALGGGIDVTSVPDKGTRVRVELPVGHDETCRK